MRKRLAIQGVPALLLGIIAGLAIRAISASAPALREIFEILASVLSAGATLFLRLVEMVVAPFLFSACIVGVTAFFARETSRKMWLVAIAAALLLIVVAAASALWSSGAQKPPGIKEVVTAIVPSSVFDALARNQVAPIAVFSIVFGISAIALGEPGKPVLRAANALLHVSLQMLAYVLRLAPLALSCFVAGFVAARGTGLGIDLNQLVDSLSASSR